MNDASLNTKQDHGAQLCSLLTRHHPTKSQPELIADIIPHADAVRQGLTALTSAQTRHILATRPHVALTRAVAQDLGDKLYNNATLSRWIAAAKHAQPHRMLSAYPILPISRSAEPCITSTLTPLPSSSEPWP